MKSQLLILSLATTFLTLLATTASAQPEVIHVAKSTTTIATETLNLQKIQTKSSVQTTSGKAEIALARHLRKIGAKFYGAFWCGYCARQKSVFGQAALKSIRYIECDPRGVNPRTQLCRQVGIQGYPTWEIKGRFYRGYYSLEDIANISGYKGRRDFKY